MDPLSCGETHVLVHCTVFVFCVICTFIDLIDLINVPNVETLIFWVPASSHFMF